MAQARKLKADPPERAYEPVVLGDYWGLVSLICFAGSLTTRYLIAMLPPRLQGYQMMPPLAVILVPILSLLGMIVGLTGSRRTRTYTTARVGFLLNLVVFGLSTLWVGLIWVYFRTRG